ncbi:MAG: hypothetical protein HZY75_01135 [Nocardioidaceae bacterium]|nr:MAG: hypothetical protein HZY75_01135 [Nocardioidaceae bacterium]
MATLLPTPPRVTVTALAPTGRAGAAVAAAAWLTEWIPDEPQPDREFTVWIGAGVGARLDALCASHDIEPGRL